LWLLFQAREGVQQVREGAVLLARVSRTGLQTAQEGMPCQAKLKITADQTYPNNCIIIFIFHGIFITVVDQTLNINIDIY